MNHLQETLAEFDKEFANIDLAAFDARRNFVDAPEAIKAFITSRYKDLEERIEGMSTDWRESNLDHTNGYEKALDDVLSIIRDNH